MKSTVWGVFPMGVITLALGAVLTKIAGEYDISLVLIQVGLPIIGILSIILSTWTTNSANAYSGGLDIVMTFGIPDNRRREVTIAAGIVGTLLGAFGILDHIEGFLSLLAFLVCPVGGIMLADYWIIGKGKKRKLALAGRRSVAGRGGPGDFSGPGLLLRRRILRYFLRPGALSHRGTVRAVGIPREQKIRRQIKGGIME